MADTEQKAEQDADAKKVSVDADISINTYIGHPVSADADILRNILNYVYDFRSLSIDDSELSFNKLTDKPLQTGTYKMTLLDFNGIETGFKKEGLVTKEKSFTVDEAHTATGITSIDSKGNIIYTLTVKDVAKSPESPDAKKDDPKQDVPKEDEGSKENKSAEQPKQDQPEQANDKSKPKA